jgi:hypothetical protein
LFASTPVTVCITFCEKPMILPLFFASTSGNHNQAELTLLHCPEAEGALKATAYRFCASRQSLEATGTFAFVPV